MFELSAGPLKEWMPAIIGGVFSLIALILTTRSRKRSELRGRDWERERIVRVEAEKARELDLAQNVNQAQDLTARFRTLMEGYENRIKELTNDLATCKMERDRSEKLYDDRQLLCNVCPMYLEHMRTRDARTPS